MQLQAGTCFFTCSFLLLWTAAATADDVIMPSQDMESYDEERGKRPFCNAFTGCGKKRSGDASPLASLMDLNAEPAVAELSRQILSEAKLWEAIQEARDELVRRQHKMQSQVNHLSPRNLGGLRSFRKRRSLAPAGPSRLEAGPTKDLGRPVRSGV